MKKIQQKFYLTSSFTCQSQVDKSDSISDYDSYMSLSDLTSISYTII